MSIVYCQLYFKHQTMAKTLIAKQKKRFQDVYIFQKSWVCSLNSGKFRSHRSREREEPGTSEVIAHRDGKNREVQKPFLAISCTQIVVFCNLKFLREPGSRYALAQRFSSPMMKGILCGFPLSLNKLCKLPHMSARCEFFS